MSLLCPMRECPVKVMGLMCNRDRVLRVVEHVEDMDGGNGGGGDAKAPAHCTLVQEDIETMHVEQPAFIHPISVSTVCGAPAHIASGWPWAAII